MKYKTIIPWLALAAIVFGCVPKRYEWSPDGQWMTVISNDGLSFADADGKLLPGTIKGVNAATWFGDSKRLLVCRQSEATTWAQISPLLTAEQSSEIAEAARLAGDILMNFDWKTADPKNPWQALETAIVNQETQAKRDTSIYQSMGAVIGIYMREHADDALRQKVPPDRWKELMELTQTVNSVEVFSFDANGPKPGATVMTTLWDVRELRVSPTGNAAVVVTKGQMPNSWSDEDQACDLWLVATDGGRPAAKIATFASWYPDWSPDGRDILFVRTPQAPASKETTLGSLSRIRAIDQNGKFLDQPQGPEDLVGLIYSEFSRVRCLKDGRIIFATVQVTLPATSGDMPQRPQLFEFDPGKLTTVSRLLSRQSAEDIGDSAQYFEVSPDDSRVCIPDGTGKVTVVDLGSGLVTTVQDKPVPIDNNQGSLVTVPAWRSADELTFAAPGDQQGNTKVMLWSISKNSGKVLSADWPAQMTQQHPPATQP
jgi:hypothetical protein